MILDGRVRRLGIYFFFDEQGVVDDYVVKFIGEISKSLTRLVVVVNGEVNEEGRSAFEALGASPLIVRRNEGFDVWAYKTALEEVGWADLAGYDELIMMNFTIMGPVGSFEPMFAEMDARDLDFWGITIHNGASFDPWGKMANGMIPLHLQSHFIAVRSPMHSSPEFKSYWSQMGPIDSYEDSIARHEVLFTERFESAGFRWGCFVDTEDLIDETYYPLFNMPVDLLQNRQSPIFKRKSFFAGLELYLDENSNRPARELLNYLTRSDVYDVNLVWDHIIRSANHSDVVMALNLFEVLDSSATVSRSPTTVGAIVGVANPAELSRSLSSLDALPEGAKLVVVAPKNGQTLRGMREVLETSRWSGAVLIPADVSGAAWSPLSFYGDQLDGVDLVCVIESAAPGLFPFTNARSAEVNAIDAVLGSSGYVARVIESFDRSPRLGMLVPPRSLHHKNFGQYGHEWAELFDDVSTELRALGVSTPIDRWKSPVAPGNGKYWIRGEILARTEYRRLCAPQRHPSAIALIAPFIVQASGFYSSYAMPDFLASNFLTNFTHMIRRSNQQFGIGADDSFSMFHSRLQAVLFGSAESTTREESGAHLYLDYGSGFSEHEMVNGVGAVTPGSGTLQFTFNVPHGVKALRFDPVEGIGCTCVGVRAVADQASRIRLAPVNGVRHGRFDIFETTDPQYIAYVWPRGSSRITVTIESMTFLRPPFRGRRRPRGLPLLWHKARRVLGRFRPFAVVKPQTTTVSTGAGTERVNSIAKTSIGHRDHPDNHG